MGRLPNGPCNAAGCSFRLCPCDWDFWCSTDDMLRHQFNCSGSQAGRMLWNNITNEDVPTEEQCKAMTSVCDGNQGAHGATMQNTTCDDSCYDFCWIKDVGDCADMDDSQIYCVGECMSYCTKTHCEQKPAVWSQCQTSCINKFMLRDTKDINFVDFSMCMSTCTSVPI